MKVISVNISKEKGTIKKPVESIELFAEGVKHDAHAGKWHRQVSMLGMESIRKFEKKAGRTIHCGEFAENITTEGLILYECLPFDIFQIGEVTLELTQIGKKCHGDQCAIFREVGNCVMPKEGIFCRVVRGGTVSPGDLIRYEPKTIRILVVTLSDRASSGEYTDRSGPVIEQQMKELFLREGWPVETDRKIIPDDAVMLRGIIEGAVGRYDLVFTTGGTGLGPRDITVETLRPMIDKEIPGIMEMVRIRYGGNNPNALLSRSLAGITGTTALFALPGSVKAVSEYIDEISRLVVHLLFMIHGIDRH